MDVNEIIIKLKKICARSSKKKMIFIILIASLISISFAAKVFEFYFLFFSIVYFILFIYFFNFPKKNPRSL